MSDERGEKTGENTPGIDAVEPQLQRISGQVSVVPLELVFPSSFTAVLHPFSAETMTELAQALDA
jgi:hypothetical protein